MISLRNYIYTELQWSRHLALTWLSLKGCAAAIIWTSRKKISSIRFIDDIDHLDHLGIIGVQHKDGRAEGDLGYWCINLAHTRAVERCSWAGRFITSYSSAIHRQTKILLTFLGVAGGSHPWQVWFYAKTMFSVLILSLKTPLVLLPPLFVLSP